MKHIFLLPAAALLLFASCNLIDNKKIVGNGQVVSQERRAGAIHGIRVANALNVVITQGAAQEIKVEADENLQEYIIVEEKNGILSVHQRNNTSLSSRKDIAVYVSAAAFDRLYASGAGKIRSTNRLEADEKLVITASGASEIDIDVKVPRVNADLSGASTLKIKGETRDLLVSASGSSRASAFDLLAENTNVDVSGASNARVFASVKLDIVASGASEVRYRGDATVNKSTSGASNAKKDD